MVTYEPISILQCFEAIMVATFSLLEEGVYDGDRIHRILLRDHGSL